jgi:hypothetical protein
VTTVARTEGALMEQVQGASPINIAVMEYLKQEFVKKR